MIIHSGVKSHTCSECKKSSQAGHLKAHMVTHTKERAYKCIHCRNSFGEAGTLKRHLLTHSGVKTYTCSECKKSFGGVGTLKNYMVTHTGEKIHKCAECRDAFARPYSENAHAHPEWEEATQVHTMRFCIFTCRQY